MMNYFYPLLFFVTLLSPSFFIYLINLEAIIILLYTLYFYSFTSFGALFILCIAVVESCLGLVCLILNIRCHGKDLMMTSLVSFNLKLKKVLYCKNY